jgi:DNA invertase Pin-like site-specific DNA recombinase
MSTKTRRAIGIARQSHGDGESVAQQVARIKDACERDGLELVAIYEEQDVSGRTPLDKRSGLRPAIEDVEAGRAEVIIGAYFDRLMRSLKVQAELVERVEAKGGQVLALDTGQVTNGSAGQWLSSTMLGMVAEYHARTTAERTADSIQAAIDGGVPPWPRVTHGYRRREDGTYEPDPAAGRAVARAFALRVSGATIGDVRQLLRGQGLDLSYASVGRLLANRAVLGEIHYGSFRPNLKAHEPIVDREVWKAAQRVKVSAGRKAKSERLLARLGVLRCGSCGGRMSASTGHRGTFAIYRCGAHAGDPCPRRVTISAELVEGIVVDAVKAALADAEGRASAEQGAQRAAHTLERAQSQLDALIGLLDPLEPAARKRLEAATAKRDHARDEVERLGGTRASLTLNAARDWDRLSLDARRGLIRAVIDRVDVAPGRGADRVTVKLVGE